MLVAARLRAQRNFFEALLNFDCNKMMIKLVCCHMSYVIHANCKKFT